MFCWHYRGPGLRPKDYSIGCHILRYNPLFLSSMQKPPDIKRARDMSDFPHAGMLKLLRVGDSIMPFSCEVLFLVAALGLGLRLVDVGGEPWPLQGHEWVAYRAASRTCTWRVRGTSDGG